MRYRRSPALAMAGALALAWTAATAAPAAQDTAAAQADTRAATQSQTARTEQANRDAAVPDEARAAGAGARPSRTGAGAGAPPTARAPLPPAYGPQLYLNGKPVADPARRDPAEVHDETDTGANPAAHPAAHPSQPPGQQRRPTAEQRRQAARRRPAWQAAGEPMAPRPLRQGDAGAFDPEPVPPPAAAPQPVAPGSSVVRGCQGSFCTDASGNSFNGGGKAGVSSSGRLCTRTGVTVQCF